MHEDDEALIIMLCTRAGMLMEDASAEAVMMKRLSDIVTAIADLQRDIELALGLIRTANGLCHR